MTSSPRIGLPTNGDMPRDSARSADRVRALHLLNQGADLLEQGKVAQAIPLLESAYLLNPKSVPALLNLGAAYVLAGRFREAVPLLESARDVEPQNVMAWVNLGAAYLGNPVLASSEQQLLAIDAFQQAIRLNPAAPSAFYNLGLILKDRGERQRALAAFRRASQVDPSDRDARYWIAKLEGEVDNDAEYQA